MNSSESDGDFGLLNPVWAGSAVAAATSDVAYVAAMLRAEAALARAQAVVGLAPQGAADRIGTAAGGRFDVPGIAVRARGGGNPVIPLVGDLTAATAALDAGAAEYVHRGATSQDILDTATMVVASRVLDFVLADLDRIAEASGALAARHHGTVMAGRTLTQHAVPTTFGLKATGWRALVLDARERVARVRAGLPVQLGGAAGTLAAFSALAETASDDPDQDPGPRLVAAFAAELGLVAPPLPWHVLRTPIADLGGVLAFTAGALGKIAADVLVLSRTEIGELAEGTGGGSSAMPHKANPVRSTLIAATARQVPHLAGVLYGSLAAEDERPAGAWHAEWQPLREALRLVGGAARDAVELVEGLSVDTARMASNLAATRGLIVAERLAVELTPLIGAAEARAVVARASARADRSQLVDAVAADPDVAGLLSPERLRDLADPAAYLGSARALSSERP